MEIFPFFFARASTHNVKFLARDSGLWYTQFYPPSFALPRGSDSHSQRCHAMKRTLSSLTFLVAVASTLTAADWPAWRGPTGQGHCEEKNLPLKWSGGKNQENVKWKVPLANPGNSTPVI